MWAFLKVYREMHRRWRTKWNWWTISSTRSQPTKIFYKTNCFSNNHQRAKLVFWASALPSISKRMKTNSELSNKSTSQFPRGKRSRTLLECNHLSWTPREAASHARTSSTLTSWSRSLARCPTWPTSNQKASRQALKTNSPNCWSQTSFWPRAKLALTSPSWSYRHNPRVLLPPSVWCCKWRCKSDNSRLEPNKAQPKDQRLWSDWIMELKTNWNRD